MDNWGYTFIVLGIILQCFAVLNFFAVIEYPAKVGVIIKEHANIFNPEVVDESEVPIDVLEHPDTISLDNSNMGSLVVKSKESKV